jgi:hypothetical protein
MKAKLNLTAKEKTEIIEAARFAEAQPGVSFMNAKEWAIFRRRVNDSVQDEAAKGFKAGAYRLR